MEAKVHEDDPLVLTYHASQVHGEDIALLHPGRWLNDRIIAFVGEYFVHEVFKKQNVLFMHPGAVMIAQFEEGEDLADSLGDLNLSTASYILIPINDNLVVDRACGGSHWSLLAYDRKADSFAHFDSMTSVVNASVAETVAQHLAPLVGSTNVECKHRKCPQQTNGYDCGVYALCFAQAVCLNKASTETLPAVVSAASVTAFRREILAVLNAKMRRKEPTRD